MFWVYAPLLLLLNAVWLLISLAGIPGNWLMIGSVALFDWWRDEQVVHWGVWVAVIGLAVTGEIIELVAGAIGARKYGGSKWASLGALAGGLIGAIIGTFFIPLPVLGTILGAVLGAFTGSTSMELARGTTRQDAMRVGKGAAFGHMTGNLTKFAIGSVIWVILAIAVLNP